MPFCTIVEFDWKETADRARFEELFASVGADQAPPEGCLTRIVGIDDKGARTIEVWRSPADARAFAEKSAPALAGAQFPAPARVSAFETTVYQVS
jgi:hypothetical protein